MNWINEFPSAVTVCDKNGIILYMNEKSCKTFSKDGGASLIGKSLYDCHPETANAKIKELMLTQKANSYTIEKNGIKKLIHQSPWFEKGEFMGMVEISMEIPFEMPHFVRK
jgi:transcriptional regulator with PAS, ATPase and Fis domain